VVGQSIQVSPPGEISLETYGRLGVRFALLGFWLQRKIHVPAVSMSLNDPIYQEFLLVMLPRFLENVKAEI
jgi:hypothetical protein